MPFTDDDLKRLKERMKEADVPASHVKLLLARLEAAELLNESVKENCHCFTRRPEIINAYEAWRKSAGKENRL